MDMEYGMELSFFFAVESAMAEFMAKLSMQSLYHNVSITSMSICRAMNSEPKNDDSTVLCDVEYQQIEFLFLS